jgi:hypothetical protein
VIRKRRNHEEVNLPGVGRAAESAGSQAGFRNLEVSPPIFLERTAREDFV